MSQELVSLEESVAALRQQNELLREKVAALEQRVDEIDRALQEVRGMQRFHHTRFGVRRE